MSLTVYLEAERIVNVYDANITSNLANMARAVGIYQLLWHPETCGIQHARDLTEPLQEGLDELLANHKKYKEYDTENGWGTYDQFVPWLMQYIKACKQNPDATVSTCVQEII